MEFTTYNPANASTFNYLQGSNKPMQQLTPQQIQQLKWLGFNPQGQHNAWGNFLTHGGSELLAFGAPGLAIPMGTDYLAGKIANNTPAAANISNATANDNAFGLGLAELMLGAATGAAPMAAQGGMGLLQHFDNGGLMPGGSHASGNDLAIVDKNSGADTGVRVEGGELLFSKERTARLLHAILTNDKDRIQQIVHEQMSEVGKSNVMEDGGSIPYYDPSVAQGGASIPYYDPSVFQSSNVAGDAYATALSGTGMVTGSTPIQNAAMANAFKTLGSGVSGTPGTNQYDIMLPFIQKVAQGSPSIPNAALANTFKTLISGVSGTPAPAASGGGVNWASLIPMLLPAAQTPTGYITEAPVASKPSLAPIFYNNQMPATPTPAPAATGGGLNWASLVPMLLPAAQTAIGYTNAAHAKLPKFTLPQDFQNLMRAHYIKSQEGLSPEERIAMDRSIEDARRLHTQQIYQAAGGNPAAILGNLSGMSDEYLNAKLKEAAMNEAAKRENQAIYGNDVSRELGIAEDIYNKDYAQALLRSQAASNLLNTGLTNAQSNASALALNSWINSLPHTSQDALNQYYNTHV